jgi:hypothetical protein
MVGAFDIDRPDIVIGPQDIARREHGRQHRMILVVVPMLPVSSHALEVFDRVHPGRNHGDRVLVHRVIDGIRLRLSDDIGIDHVLRLSKAQSGQFIGGKLAQRVIAPRPDPLVLLAEVLHSDRSLMIIGQHVGGPGSEILDTAHPHLAGMDVNPVVGKRVGPVQDKRDDEEIAILQPVRGRDHLRGWGRVHGVDEFLQGHRADDITCRHFVGRSRAIRDLQRADTMIRRGGSAPQGISAAPHHRARRSLRPRFPTSGQVQAWGTRIPRSGSRCHWRRKSRSRQPWQGTGS